MNIFLTITRFVTPVLLLTLMVGSSCNRSDSGNDTSTRSIKLASQSTTAYTPILDGPIRALSQSPSGPMSKLPDDQQILITFTKPMVSLGSASAPDPSMFTLSPAVPGKLAWHGTQTLVFSPSQRLPFATRFDARVRSGLVSVEGDTLHQNIAWSFSTPAPEIVSVNPVPGFAHLRPTDTLRVFFNQPILASAAQPFIDLAVGNREDVSRTVVNLTPTTLAIVSEQPLKLDSKVVLRLRSGLPSEQGSITLRNDEVVQFMTYGKGRFVSVSQSGSQSSFKPGTGFSVEFSNPVSMKDFREAIRLEPQTGFATGSVPNNDESEATLFWPVELLPSTNYELVVSGLHDIFGQEIPRTVQRFATTSYQPEISLPSGILVVEGGQKHNLTVSAVNITGARLGMKSIGVDEIVPSLSGFVQPYPDYYADESDSEIEKQFEMLPLDLSSATNQWKSKPIPLDPVLSNSKGIVLVNAYVPKQRDWYGGRSYRSIAQVTELGVTAKYSPHQIEVFVTKLSDASPVTEATVSIRGSENKVKWRGQTNADGLVRIPGWDALKMEAADEWSRPSIFVIVEHGGDVAFASSEVDRGIEPYRLGVSYDWNPTRTNYSGSVFTDRGLYRTGETVSMKAILRQRADEDWTVLRDSINILIRSPRDEIVLERSFLPSDFGGVNLEWIVPRQAAQGTYYVSVSNVRGSDGDSYDSGIASGYFRVDAFRTSTFAVTASASSDQYVAGDFLEGTISGRYLFGAAMGGQPASYSLTRNASYFSPPGYEGFAFGGRSYSNDGPDLYRRIARTDTVLSSDGSLPLRVQLPGNDYGQVTSVSIEGTVTDPARQSLSARETVTLHPALFYLGLKPNTSFLDLSKSKRQTVDVIAVDPSGVPVDAADVALSVLRLQWNSVREVGTDGRLRWRSERTEELITTASLSIKSGSGEQVSFGVEQGGSYIIRARTADLRGNSVQTDTYFYATGSGYVAWERSDDDMIELIADRSSYKPGDVATILIPSPYESAMAYVSVEREGIISSFVRQVTGSAPKIEVPLSERHLPNAFVSVILLSGRTAAPSGMQDLGAPGFKIGYVNIGVDAGERHLTVEVVPSTESTRPGEELTVSFSVRDKNNKGVPAEITFSAADAGVLNLIGYRLPDPFDAFYGQRPLGVSTTESRSHLVRQRNFGQKEEDAGGGGGGSSNQMRTDFRPLAHWEPAIRTDNSGKATVTFKLPESLTTFRLMATAATMDSDFGYGGTDVVVTKPLVLQQALPRFARLGDSFVAGVLISNQTGEAGTARVTASPSGLLLQGDQSMSIRLSAGETKEVPFAWSVDQIGEAVINFSATLGDETDALQSTVPIALPLAKTTTATLSQTDATATESILLPSGRVTSLDKLTTTIAGTSLVGLGGAITYLFDYPYGCLEQRTSRIRPLLIASDLVESFGLSALDGNSPELIDTWLADLDQFWTGSGFSLWPGGQYTPPYLNAYVVAALAEAEEAGFDIPRQLTAEAVNTLEEMVRRRSERPAYYGARAWKVSRAFMLYALAKHNRILDDEIRELILDELNSKSTASIETVSYLLRTIVLSSNRATLSFRERLLDRLRSSLTVEATTTYAAIPDDEEFWWIYSTTNRATALATTALTAAAPTDEAKLLGQRMINYLLSQRSKGYWASTQENVSAVEAFAAYFNAFEKADPNFVATVSLAGNEVFRHVVEGRSTSAVRNEIDTSPIADATETEMTFAKSGVGTLFYSLQLDTYTTDPLPAGSQGLSVSRSIQRLDKAGKNVGEEEMVGDQPVELDAGELVRITLRLNSRAGRNYVVVDDALPAGLEALNAAFETTSQEQAKDTGSTRWWGSFNHTEIKDDRVLLFADYLQRGEHTYRYVARATTPGAFVYPAVQSELMYQPSVNGRTATGKLIVNPDPAVR